MRKTGTTLKDIYRYNNINYSDPCLHPIAKSVDPISKSNTERILLNVNHIELWLNKMKVLEYERKSNKFGKLVRESKYGH